MTENIVFTTAIAVQNWLKNGPSRVAVGLKWLEKLRKGLEIRLQATNLPLTAMQMIRREYEQHGYTLPGIVFWNIQSRNKNFPVRFDEKGTALVSGLSPSIMKSILVGNIDSPESIMNITIDSDRYKMIVI